MRRIPPLSALRYFQAAARHANFRRAAEDLHVTTGAVSQQIGSLEVFLGRPLFRRTARGVVLTPEAEELQRTVTAIFEQLEKSIALIRAMPEREVLTVAVGRYFAAHWLMPRLGRFWKQHPAVDLRLCHTPEGRIADGKGADLAVIWGHDPSPNLSAEALVRLRTVAVCSPSIVREGDSIVAGGTLLHFRDRRYWATFLEATGLPSGLAERGPVFDDYNILNEAAVAGQGIALGARPLVDRDLACSRLAPAHPREIQSAESYYLAYRPDSLARPVVRTFRSWLFAEAGTSEPRP